MQFVAYLLKERQIALSSCVQAVHALVKVGRMGHASVG